MNHLLSISSIIFEKAITNQVYQGVAKIRKNPAYIMMLAVVFVIGIGTGDAFCGTTERVSIPYDGVEADGPCYESSVSEDGRYVAFDSQATNLVESDTNYARDIFVRDMVNDVTELVSVRTDGSQALYQPSMHLSISADGRYVAFISKATFDDDPPDTNGSYDVFVHDRENHTTERINLTSDEEEGPLRTDSYNPSLSADGRYVAFGSRERLVPEDQDYMQDIYVRDTVDGFTYLVSINSDGIKANNASYELSISTDGRYVAFASYATNLDLVTNENDVDKDIFVHDRVEGTTERVSIDSDHNESHGDSDKPVISNDGRYVAFRSSAADLVLGDTNNCSDIFIHDRQTHKTERMSISSDGEQGNGYSDDASISGDGRYVAFSSAASNLIPIDDYDKPDVFVHDRQTGITEIATVASDGTQSNWGGDYPSISNDGFHVSFRSAAWNLTGEFGSLGDIYIHERTPAADTTPPRIEMNTPSDGDHNVPIDTEIIVTVSDDGSGVNDESIVVEVAVEEEPGVWTPKVITPPVPVGTPASYTLTVDPNLDDSDYDKNITVTVSAYDMATNYSESEFSFLCPSDPNDNTEPSGDDTDGDGISNNVEEDIFGTDPEVPTLFLRPKDGDEDSSVYWEEFIELFPWNASYRDPAKEGFAYIPSFAKTDSESGKLVPFIEVSVIGDPRGGYLNPYGPMQDYNYDPANDPEYQTTYGGVGDPPCDILEIYYRPWEDYVMGDNNKNFGHTWFYYENDKGTWSWDTKGYTPNVSGSSPLFPDEVAHFNKYGYFTAFIYSRALTRYIEEGVYNQIAVTEPLQAPQLEDPEGDDGSRMPGQFYGFSPTYSSALNLNDLNPQTGDPDLTVEFNDIAFNADAEITGVPTANDPEPARYTREDVLRRTIIHELGHAILAGASPPEGSEEIYDPYQHCTYSDCIMSEKTSDWELHPFGSTSGCEHSPGGIYDIRGKIHNGPH